MKPGFCFCLFFICPILHASNIVPLPDDTFTTQEKADEGAKIINQNFQNLWNDKIDASSPTLGSPSYFIGDFLDPDSADYNCFVIMENADDLWRNKVSADGVINTNGRAYNLADLLNPDEIEQKIGIINQILYDLDSQKGE